MHLKWMTFWLVLKIKRMMSGNTNNFGCRSVFVVVVMYYLFIDNPSIICSELNKLVAMLAPVCECAVMCAPKSTTFLCAAHEPPKECDAMSYMNHTLDSAASVLTSERHFPSRVQIKPTSLRQIPSIARRVYRVLAHAYFLHREVYDEFESEHHVCERFHKLAVKYKLISQEQLVVPIDS
eukprot:m.22427 g.22427  ORF g.22427 m.22427 type:complete len:180 (+) comp7399_c0_seq1:268-807(+)